MKKNEVEIGGEYTAKISGRMTVVRVLSEGRRGGYMVRNLKTNREVHFRSAARLRAVATDAIKELYLGK